MKPQTRIIKWRDSRKYLEQLPKDENFDVCVITSIGFIVSEDKQKIVLAQDIIDEDVRGIIVIPKENILK